MPQLDLSTFIPQLFWLFVSFGLLYCLLSKFCLPQLTNIFVRRELQMSEDMKAAYLAKDEALKLKVEYELILSNAAKVKSEMLLEASKDLVKLMDQKLVDFDLELQQLAKESQDRMTAFQASMSEDVNQIAKEASEAILKAIGDINVSGNVVSRAINEVKIRNDSHAI